MNFLQLSGCLLYFFGQHNYPPVHYNEHFGLLKCDSANFLHAIFIFMNFLQLSGCLLNISGCLVYNKFSGCLLKCFGPTIFITFMNFFQLYAILIYFLQLSACLRKCF